MLELAQSLLVFLCLWSSVSCFPFFQRPNVTFNHMAYDNVSETIYIGAVNWIFQVSSDLQLLSEDSTGPVFDSPECLPFKDIKDCPQATLTHNSNKLLTVNTFGKELLTCGHVFQGICEKRDLANISNIIYRTVDPGDNQFVAANDPKVTTVGIVQRLSQDNDYLFVGRGLTARLSSGIPPITIRQVNKPPVFSNEGLGKLVVGDFSDYNNTFVGVFSYEEHVYFLFYRRGSKSQMEYKTYLASVCSKDINLYSYVEVPLVCEGGYNLAQAAHLETTNKELFVIFAASQGATPSPSSRTALCSYKMTDIERRIETSRILCYTENGKGPSGQEAIIEYGVNSKCAALPKESPQNFKCGGDHTPSPIASTVPVTASPLLTNDSSLSAVTALVNDSRTVVFLGDAEGHVHKVFVTLDKGHVYSSLVVVPGSPVSSDLVLDGFGQHLYVMTESQVTKLPVAECFRFPSCDSCLGAADPFCGWCVLQGRCTEKQECADSAEANHWLWSYDQDQCVSIHGLSPANQSRHEQTEVSMTVLQLPTVAEKDDWKCLFNNLPSSALIYGNQVRCSSPPPDLLPPNDPGKDHMTVRLALVFRDVPVADTEFIYYDCGAVMDLSVSNPCSACVSSPWRCYWCLSDRICTHTVHCKEEQTVIYSQNDVSSQLWGPDWCPRLEKVEGSHLIPVGLERELDLVGRNFHLLNGEALEYSCIIEVEGMPVSLRAQIEKMPGDDHLYKVHCQTHKYEYPLHVLEHPVTVYVKKGETYRVDNNGTIEVSLYNCSVGQSDCSRCQALSPQYGCLWCGEGDKASCLHTAQCEQNAIAVCPTPLIHSFTPLTGVVEGGTSITITGTDMGQRADEVSVTVSDQSCNLLPDRYVVSNSIVCILSASGEEMSGPVKVSVHGREPGFSSQLFTYQDPILDSLSPMRGPMAGGTLITISGSKLLTGDQISVTVGNLICEIFTNVTEDQIMCVTSPSPVQQEMSISVSYGSAKRDLEGVLYNYTENPTVSSASPLTAFYKGGRTVVITGSNLDVVQTPQMRVLARSPVEELRSTEGSRRRKRRRRREALPNPVQEFSEPCKHDSSTVLKCVSPLVPDDYVLVDVLLVLDNLQIPFSSFGNDFTYQKNPTFKPLNRDSPNTPYSLKPGNVLDIEGEGLDSGISKQEVQAMIGNGVCAVKTLTHNHLYCEPPLTPPQPLEAGASLPEFVVKMGNLRFDLGQVKYDEEGQPSFPKEAKIGLGVGAALLIPVVLIIIFMYRRQSKLAMRDYKKVLVQLENLETSVGDQCRKEFTDLMTEMMDLTSDIEGSGIPFLDYKTYVEKIFFPGDTISPIRKSLDVLDNRRSTVEQGLTQFSNLLNNKLFLIKLIETLDAQPTLSQRDRCHVASLITVALLGKLEYLTDVMKTLLSNLIDQCVAKNPKLLLRRTETVVEKLLTNWMSICLHSFLREAAAEPLYMLFCAIKYQVDKGPVDAVSGKAKRTLNDCRLLREDIEYRQMTLTVIVKNGSEVQRVPVKVLDTDTITQVKGKILNHVYKGTPFSQRPAAHTLDLEWRSGQAGHLTLSDEDLTSLVQDQWKRLNTLHHYKVPNDATVALIPRLHNNQCETPNNSFLSGERTPMLEDGEDGGIRTWHLVKCVEEPEVCKVHRRSSLRERERAKAIPEIYLTRLLSMKGTLQKFVDDTFQVMLGINRPVPIAIKYFFDFLDEMAEKHGIEDAETVHIWKTHSLMQRFWVLILKNPQMVFDIEVSENVDSILSVIAQTFIDSCTTSEHNVGRDSPVNKLLYAREIPRYKQLVEKYYADIRQTAAASYQEMNSSLTELSGVHAADLNSLVALQELYNYINKYYDQISTALEEDPSGQKMQLAYRLQQISALVENKVTDL